MRAEKEVFPAVTSARTLGEAMKDAHQRARSPDTSQEGSSGYQGQVSFNAFVSHRILACLLEVPLKISSPYFALRSNLGV